MRNYATGSCATHADPALPVVDVGCGNGRFTRALAARSVGTDLSANAGARAREESAVTAGPGSTHSIDPAPGTER